MNNILNIENIAGWLISLLLIAIGILNIIFVHLVPGMAYILFSCVYLPPINTLIKNNTGFTIPLLVKIILGIALFMFTLGVSDLGDMIDKL